MGGPPGERFDGRDAAISQSEGVLEFEPRFRGAQNLTRPRPRSVRPAPLDVDGPTGEVDARDGPLEVLLDHLDEAGLQETVARYKKVGVTHFIFMLFTPYFVDELQAFAEEVIPAARRV